MDSDPKQQTPSDAHAQAERDFVFKVVSEHTLFLRQVAGYHMTWLAFHAGFNLTLLAYLADEGNNVSRKSFLVFAGAAVAWNVLGAIGSWRVGDYYQSAARKLKAADDAFPKVPGVVYSDVLPVRNWIGISRIIALVCVIFAFAWIATIALRLCPQSKADDETTRTSAGAMTESRPP